MTYTKNKKNNVSHLDENQVVDYLFSHPEFLDKHKEILAEINASHGFNGNVTSLIERQVSILRDKNKESGRLIEAYRSRYEQGMKNFKTINALSQQLLETQTLTRFYQLFKQEMLGLYAASQVRLYLFINNISSMNIEGISVLRSDADLRFMFTELLNRNKPLCGSLQAEHLTALFHSSADSLCSTVIVPLKCRRWVGLLALGSQCKDQYSHGVELELLVLLSKLLTLYIQKELESN